MGYGISTATATQNPQELGAPTYINFGAGYIDAPLDQTQTPDQSNTASTPGGNGGVSAGIATVPASGAETTVAGLTTTQLLIVAGVGILVVGGIALLILERRP
jgi:hypothetical protein